MIHFSDVIDKEIDGHQHDAYLTAGYIEDKGITCPLTDDEIEEVNEHQSGDICEYLILDHLGETSK